VKEIINPVQIEYLRSIRNEKNQLTLELEEYAEANKVPILNWKAAELLQLLIHTKRPKRVLEIGMAIGYSSILIAGLLGKKGKLHTIEKSKNNIKTANQNIERAGLTDKIKIKEGDALEIMPKMEKKYDFIFLDADKQDYEKLFNCALELLKKGGVIFVDNLLWHGCVAAKTVPSAERKSTEIIRGFNEIFINSPMLKSTIYPVGDGIGVGIRI
jgi:caffeoyl-CoA O-methyltransferase